MPPDTFQALFLLRMGRQGPEHPSTMATMLNLLKTELGAETATRETATREPAGRIPAELPDESLSGEVRLDGDHVELELQLSEYSIDLQDRRVSAYGSEATETMAATCYLAYCLAVADHIDGQSGTALLLVQDSYDGLADALDDLLESDAPPPEQVANLRQEVEIADQVRAWVMRKVEEADE
jgi:hypothetical protein